MLAESRIAHLEGLARARQQKPKRRRDTDARLYEEYVKITTAGEKDDDEAADNPEEEMEVSVATKPSEVFQPIVFQANAEEQKKLLLFECQGRHNQYTKDFLEEAWIKNDLFEAAAKWKSCSKHDLHAVFHALNSLSPAAWYVFTKNFCLYNVCL